MGVLGVVELQRPGDRVEDAVGGAAQAALLQPRVVVGGQAGELGDLLAAQSGDAAPGAVQLQPSLLRV